MDSRITTDHQTPVNQEIGAAKGTHIVDPHSVQDTQAIRNAHNQGVIEDVRLQERLRSEREQLSSESLKEQSLSDSAKLAAIQTALQKDLTKVEKDQARLEGKQGIVDKMKDGLSAGLLSAKDRIIGIPAEPVVGDASGSEGMPGRYHPEPAPLEAGLMTRIGDKVQGGLASAQAGLASAQAGLISAKDRVIGPTVEPIEGGMPGRTHPHPESLEARGPGVMTRIGDSVAAGLGSVQAGLISAKDSAQAGLISAKDRVVGPTVEPIEGGMPARYHPDAESLEAPAPGLMDRVKTGLTSAQTTAQSGLATVQSSAQSGLASVQSAAQSGLATAQAGLATARDVVIGPSQAIEEVRMPGRYHPRAAELEHQPAGPVWKSTTGGGSEVEKEHIDLEEAKSTLEREFAPVAGMPGPGRNHPNPETLETPSIGVATRIGDTVKGIASHPYVQSAKDTVSDIIAKAPAVAASGVQTAKDTVQLAKDTALPYVQSARDTAGPYVQSARDTAVPRAQSYVQSAKDTAIPYVQSAKDTVTNLISRPQPTAAEIPLARSEIESKSIDTVAASQTLEQLLPHQMEGMPGAGRYHPHPQELENLGLMDKMKIGLASAKDSLSGGLTAATGGLTAAAASSLPYLSSAKDRIIGPTVEPIETGMPGRNHPQPEALEAPAPGLATRVGDTVKQGVATAKETAMPYVQSAKDTAMPYVQSAKDTAMPYVQSAKDTAVPYVQSAKDTALPYVQSAKAAITPASATPASTTPATATRVETAVPTPILGSGASTGDAAALAQDAALLNAQASLIKAQAGLLSAQAGLLARRAEDAAPVLPSQTLAPPPSLGALETQTQPQVQPQGPGIMTKIGEGLASAKGTAQAGLTSATTTAQPYLSSAKDTAQAGISSAQAGISSMATSAQPYLSSAKDTAQAGLTSVAQKAQPYVTAAKEAVMGPAVEPIDSGMPGRYHPHPAPLEAGLMTRVGEKVQGSLASAQQTAQPYIESAKQTAQPYIASALETGRQAPETISRLGETVKGGLVSAKDGLISAKDQVVASRETTHPGMFLEPVSVVDHKSIDQSAAKEKLEQTLPEEPARNHPDAASLKAQDAGLMTRISSTITAPLTYAKDTLVSAKDRIVGMGSSTVHAEGTVPLSGPRSEILKDSIDQQAVKQKMEETLAEGAIDPLGGVLAPGRNHPDADSLKAHDQGYISSITDKIKSVFIGDKSESV